MITVKLDPDAAEHIRSKGSEYRSFESDGVRVHVHWQLDKENTSYHISLDKLFNWRFLSVSLEGGFLS